MILSAIGGAISGIGNLIGGSKAKKRQKKADRLLDDQQKDLDKWYNDQMNQSYLDSNDAQNTLSALRRSNDLAFNTIQNNASRRGLTDEAKVAASADINNRYADVVSQLSGREYSYKKDIDNRYRNAKQRIKGQKYQNEINRSQSSALIGDVFDVVGNSISRF